MKEKERERAAQQLTKIKNKEEREKTKKGWEEKDKMWTKGGKGQISPRRSCTDEFE